MEADPGAWAASGGPTRDPAAGHVDGGHEPARPVAAVAHTPALAHRDQLHGVHRSEVLAGAVVDQTARVQRQARPEEALAPLGRSG